MIDEIVKMDGIGNGIRKKAGWISGEGEGIRKGTADDGVGGGIDNGHGGGIDRDGI